jgi:hypothetical protein
LKIAFVAKTADLNDATDLRGQSAPIVEPTVVVWPHLARFHDTAVVRMGNAEVKVKQRNYCIEDASDPSDGRERHPWDCWLARPKMLEKR